MSRHLFTVAPRVVRSNFLGTVITDQSMSLWRNVQGKGICAAAIHSTGSTCQRNPLSNIGKENVIKSLESLRGKLPFDTTVRSQIRQLSTMDTDETGYSREVVEIPIKSGHAGSIIGSGGRNIHELQNRTGASISINPSADERGEEMVTIRGHESAVEMAKAEIEALINKMENESDYVQLPIGKQFVVELIGHKGSNIHRVQDQTGARVRIDASDRDDEEIVTITGSPDAVAMAKGDLEAQIEEMRKTCLEMQVDPQHFYKIIGAGGEIVRDLQRKSGCRINVPKKYSGTNIITIWGDSEGMEYAKSEIEAIVNGQQGSGSASTVYVKNEFRSSLIGLKGRNIIDMERRTGTRINVAKFPRDDGTVAVSIQGPPEAVEMAKTEVEEHVKRMEEKFGEDESDW